MGCPPAAPLKMKKAEGENCDFVRIVVDPIGFLGLPGRPP